MPGQPCPQLRLAAPALPQPLAAGKGDGSIPSLCVSVVAMSRETTCQALGKRSRAIAGSSGRGLSCCPPAQPAPPEVGLPPVRFERAQR